MKKSILVITLALIVGFINAQKRVESESDLIGTYQHIVGRDTMTLRIETDTTFFLDLPCTLTTSNIANRCTGKFKYNGMSSALILSCDTTGVPILLYITPCSIQGEEFVFIAKNTNELIFYSSAYVKPLKFKRIKTRRGLLRTIKN